MNKTGHQIHCRIPLLCCPQMAVAEDGAARQEMAPAVQCYWTGDLKFPYATDTAILLRPCPMGAQRDFQADHFGTESRSPRTDEACRLDV